MHRRLQLDSDEESEEEENPQDELARYLNMPAATEDNCQKTEQNICHWWNEVGKVIFPRLAKVARAVLGIQASSTASERDFSSAGLTLASRRSSLDSEHVNELLVVRNFFKH